MKVGLKFNKAEYRKMYPVGDPMTAKQKVEALEKIFADAIAWYQHYAPLERRGGPKSDHLVDDSYTYDLSFDQIEENNSRGDIASMLHILSVETLDG